MADRDDNYRGYGSPSGRYYEAREYERGSGGGGRDRDERSWFGGDRDRNRVRDRDDNRGGWFGGDRDREHGRDRDYNRGGGSWMGGGDRGRDDWRSSRGGRGGEDRGFFERAGEEIRSWFDDDDDRGGERGRSYGRDDWRDRDRSRGYGAGGMMPGRGRGNHDRDDRPPQTFGAEPTSGGYDYRRDEWRGRGDRHASSGSYQGSPDYSGRQSRSHPHDDHYHEWRQQQISELDRDYDEYRRENRDKFHGEFSSWRGQRQQQRSSMRKVTEHMEVVGSDGQPVGTVDKVLGDKIILTKSGPMAGGHHHSIPCSWIQSVDERVTINKTAEQAREKWTDEENRRALFESDDQRNDDGPHILDRSFSGTYEGR